MSEELFREDAYLRSCEAVVRAVSEAGVVLDRTVFYPIGGGQPGDSGVLRSASGQEFAVTGCIKERGTGDLLHQLAEGAPRPAVGERVEAEIDWPRRYRLMRMHTCLHLLCAVVPGAVTGGSVGDGKGRLDFDLPEVGLDKAAIEAALNRLVEEDHPVVSSWISDAELTAQPELVRTMSVQPPRGGGRVRLIEVAGVDVQPCGGTHVRSTAEIGPVRVGKIEKKGRHNRRVNVLLDG